MRRVTAVLGLLLAIGCGEGEARPTASEPPGASATSDQPARASRAGGVHSVAVDPPAIEGAIALSPVAAGDDVIATWIEPVEGEVHRVRFAILDGATRRWSAASSVVESADVLASSTDFPIPVRAASSAYFTTLLMRGREPHASFVHVATSRDGVEWRRLGAVHDDATETEHGHASIFAEGDAVRALWLDGRAWVTGGPMSIRTALVGADGTIGAAAMLDARVCDCCQTAGATTPDGTFVAYRDRSDVEVRDIASVRRAGERWTAPAGVHGDGWTIRGCPVNGPQVAASGRRIALAWYTEGDGARVRVAFSENAGAQFGAPVDVDAARPAGRVDVEWTDDGTALVGWLGTAEDGEVSVRLRRVAPDRRVGAAVEVARVGAHQALGVPRLARLGSDVVVAWAEMGPPRRVRAATVDPDEVPAPSGEAPAAPVAADPSRIGLGAPLPDIALTDLEGGAVSLASFRGRPVVISFFATWCEPCRQEFPLLSQIAREHAEHVHVIGVSLDERSREEVAEFARAHALGYTVLHDPDGSSSRSFGVPPIPATFVFDAHGTLSYRRAGGGPDLLRELPEAVASALRAPTPAHGEHGGAAHGGHGPEHQH